ncbi:MAG: SGNH/GDSL hydrolase family protein [bacterium]
MAGLKAVDDRHRYEINQNSQNKMIYVSLGDSLTSGAGADKYEESYPYLLAARLSASDKHVINLNFSYPGARTADVIRDLLPKAIIEQPDLVTLLIGTNDIHGNVSFSETIKNYDFILQELKAKTKAKVNVISVPFIGSQTLLLPPYNWYFENKVLSLNREILILCNKYGFHYIDLTTPTAEISREDGIYYSADKFHPAATGYKMWSNIIYDNINQ